MRMMMNIVTTMQAGNSKSKQIQQQVLAETDARHVCSDESCTGSPAFRGCQGCRDYRIIFLVSDGLCYPAVLIENTKEEHNHGVEVL